MTGIGADSIMELAVGPRPGLSASLPLLEVNMPSERRARQVRPGRLTTTR